MFKILNVISTIFIIIAMLVGLGIFFVIVYNSVIVSVDLAKNAVSTQHKIFYFGVMTAIIAGCMYFIEMFIKELGFSLRSLNKKKKEVE